jgi:hypothetical protein
MEGTNPVLLESEIAGEKNHTGSDDPVRCLQWLKRRIQRNAHRGVRGRNVVHGGASTYPSIWYTARARELFESSVRWNQYPNTNSEFEPLTKP